MMKVSRLPKCSSGKGAAIAAFVALAGMSASHIAWADPSTSPGLQEVLKLTKAQLGDEVILAFIRKSGKSYDLSVDDLVALKEQGVSQVVIQALMESKPADGSGNPAPVAPQRVSQAPQGTGSPQPGSSSTPSGVAPGPVANAAAGQMSQANQGAANPSSAGGSQGTGPAAADPGENDGQQVPEMNFAYVHDQLAPAGTWLKIEDKDYWRPDAALRGNPDWKPYYDMGQWTDTENGLFWQSDYEWGDIPFHYGRWVKNAQYGWLWVPGYEWGPSWVFWRESEGDDCIGWAPLPPGADFEDGVLMFNGAAVPMDFDFGLDEDAFAFVGDDHFHEPFHRWKGHEFEHHLSHDKSSHAFHNSKVKNDFRKDGQGRFSNHGIGKERGRKLTKVGHSSFEERHPVGDREKLAKSREGPNKQNAHTSPGSKKNARPSTAKSKASPVNKTFRPPAKSGAKAMGGGGGGGGKARKR